MSSLDRRDFLRSAGVVGGGLALGARRVSGDVLRAKPAEKAAVPSADAQPTPKRLLILGGTGFIGPSMVQYAVERGHEVSIFTRGRSQVELPDVERLVGDRNDDLSALEGRQWDVILDNNARDYRWVQLSTETLKDAAPHYLFVSSISAYNPADMDLEGVSFPLAEPIVDEDAPVFRPGEEFVDGEEAPYGLTKALSEETAEAAFPGRTTVVRPGLIVGPGDPTDRFTYWPVRIDKGGEILAPSDGNDPTQIIDVRDLTEWIVRLAEAGTMGQFNATGPEARLSMAEMLYGIRAITSTPSKITFVPGAFLQEHNVRPWSDMPAWIPNDPISFVNVERAVEAGLTFRPLAVTARDTLEWHRTRPAEHQAELQAGIAPEREAEVLAAWQAARGG
jgi:2'-hydroxyisoflavone reductase